LYADGYAALQRGEYRDALSSFGRAVARDPLVTAPAQVRKAAAAAGAMLRKGDVAGATALLGELVQALPEQAEGHRLLATAYGVSEQHAKSVAHFETAVRLAPQDERARLGLAAALEAAGRVADAEQQLVDAAERFPASGAVHYELARIYETQGRSLDVARALAAARVPGPIVGQDHLHETLARHDVNRVDFDA